MLRWVFIEIELDLFVGYKTFFAFVLATDAVGGVSEMDPRRCIVSSPTMMWAPDKGRAKSMTYTNTHKRLLKKIFIEFI